MQKQSRIPLNTMKDWIHANHSQWLKDYLTFLNFPSVSADTQFKPFLLECADWLVDYLKQMDFKVELWSSTGHPVIFASYMKAGPDKPTLLIYNHYDVQPIDPLEEWLSPPFEPTLRNGEVYARGAQDNKGQCFYVLQALKLLIDQTGSLPINIKLCIEGEEEIGSPGLTHLLQDKKEALQADYLAVVDLGIPDPKIPSITLGIRGIVTFDVEVEGSQSDLHSGSHGGIAVNPIHALVQLLASLRDEKGKITIPGFYDHVAELSAEERASVSFDFDPEHYQKTIGAVPVGGEQDFTVMERAWIRPTLEINGISGGYAGKGIKTVIAAKAYAKISCRLVPNQQPDHIGKLVAAHLQTHAPKGVRVKVDVHPGLGKAVRVSPNSQVVKCFSKAYEEVFDVPCQYIFEGASIPVAADLAETCGGETILLGLGLATDQIHAPNEHFGIDRIEKGILIIAKAIEFLAMND